MEQLPSDGDSSAAESGRSNDELEEYQRRSAATAAAGVDVNDIRDWMVTRLPRRIWLQLNANNPDGEYYHPDLSSRCPSALFCLKVAIFFIVRLLFAPPRFTSSSRAQI